MVIRMISAILSLIFTATLSYAQNIRSVDFRNFTYEGEHSRIILRNGRYTEGIPPFQDKSRIVNISYCDFNEDGKEEAAITIETTIGGGSMLWSRDYYVFAYHKGKPYQVFHLWRERGKRISILGRTLRITAPEWGGEAHCCPKYMETINYRWRGTQFVVTSRRLRRIHYPD